MLFFKTQQNPNAPINSIVTEISDKAQHVDGWVSRHDFKSFEQALMEWTTSLLTQVITAHNVTTLSRLHSCWPQYLTPSTATTILAVTSRPSARPRRKLPPPQARPSTAVAILVLGKCVAGQWCKATSKHRTHTFKPLGLRPHYWR